MKIFQRAIAPSDTFLVMIAGKMQGLHKLGFVYAQRFREDFKHVSKEKQKLAILTIRV